MRQIALAVSLFLIGCSQPPEEGIHESSGIHSANWWHDPVAPEIKACTELNCEDAAIGETKDCVPASAKRGDE